MRAAVCNLLLLVILTLLPCPIRSQTCDNRNDEHRDECPESQMKYATWEEAPTSAEEFDHDNDPSICGVPRISVEQWERGRFWERERPVIVTNVTDAWPALRHWTKQEMLVRYPDVEVSMGEAKSVAQTGPDDAGDIMTRTTIQDFILNHMHDSEKYVFDRKLEMPTTMLQDCQPLPLPTRQYHQNPHQFQHERSSNIWRDHLAITIGRDQQGLTFHRHNAAWNTVIFGAKRWLLWDAQRVTNNKDRLRRMTRDINNPIQLDSPNWIRYLYPMTERKRELRKYGHDCVQRAGEMIYVPKGWVHMVLNIGDTVAVVSERGLEALEG